MVDEVNISNVGGKDGVAAEATLQKLLKAMDRIAGTQEEARQAKEDIGDLGEAAKGAGKGVGTLGKAAKAAGKSLKAGVGNTADALAGLATEFATGSLRISDFTSHLTGLANQIPVIGGLIGGPFQLLASVVDNNIDNFRQLSSVGVTFGNSVFDAQRAAAQSGLTLSQFSDTVAENSQSLALLGGSASRGGDIFRDVNRRLQSAREGFSNLGITLEETAGFTADYLEQQTVLGRAQEMRNRRLGQQTVDYIERLDELSRVTGLQRDQVSQALKEQALDRRLSGLLATMGDTARENLQGVLTTLEAQSPEVADAFKNMVATGGVPVTDFGRDMARLNPRLQELARGMRNGTVSQEEAMAEFRRTGEIAANQGDSFLQFTGTLAALGSGVGAATIQFLRMKNAAGEMTEAEQRQQELIEQGQSGLLDFERRLVMARNTIIATFINSNVFTKTIAAFESVVDYLTSDGIDDFKKMFDGFASWLDGFIADIKEYGFVEVLKEGAANAMSMLGGFLVDSLKRILFGGLSDIDEDKKSTLQQERERIQSFSPSGQAGKNYQAEKLAQINAELDKLQNQEEGLFGNLFGFLTTSIVGGTVGALLIGGGIVAALKGLSFGLSALGSPKVVLGAGILGGLAYTFGKTVQNIGTGFDLIGDGVTKVKDSLTELSEIKDTATLRDVASSLGVMGTAMDELNDRGFVDQIGDLFGRQSPFEQLMSGVKEFGTIGDRAVSSISSTADAISSLSDVNTDLDVSPVEEYTEAIKKLTEALDGLNEELADDNSTGMFNQNQNTSAGQLLGSNGVGSGSTEQLQNLNRTMKDVLGVLLESNGMNRKQLNAIRNQSGNLYR